MNIKNEMSYARNQSRDRVHKRDKFVLSVLLLAILMIAIDSSIMTIFAGLVFFGLSELLLLKYAIALHYTCRALHLLYSSLSKN